MLFLGFEECVSETALEEESLFDPGSAAQGNSDVFDATAQLFEVVHKQVRARRDRLTASTHRLRRRLNKENLQEEIKDQLDVLKKKLKEPPVVALRNKISFYLGVNTVCVTTWLLSKRPEDMSLVYLWDFILLISARIYIYRRQGYGYFTLDLCYYVNALTLIYLFVFPENQLLLSAVFSLSHGPVIWAIVQWRNSLVFHSLDKITSCFIHGFPCLALYSIRWLIPRALQKKRYPAVLMPPPTYMSTLTASIALYLVWQIGYYSIVNIFNRDKVDSGRRVTSYTWVFAMAKSRGPTSLLYRTLTCLGTAHSYAVFMSLQFAYTIITLLPTRLYWNSFALHTSLLLVMLEVAIWNGANYYVEVFSKSYATQFKALQTHMAQALDEPDNDATSRSDISVTNDECVPQANTDNNIDPIGVPTQDITPVESVTPNR